MRATLLDGRCGSNCGGYVEMAYDVCVIGAGIEGSAAAYYLVKKRLQNVLMLEQFSAIHTRGSSHGLSRITRRAYDRPYYVRMMNDAYKLWSDLERESGTTIYRRTGILVFGPSDHKDVLSTASSLVSNQVTHTVYTGREANQRYSQRLNIPDDYKCIFEDGGGMLDAQRALQTFQQQFQKHGGTLLDNHKVIEIQPGPTVTVVTNRGTFRTKQLVIAAGAWTPSLCSSIGLQLPFTVIRTEVNYWKVEDAAMFTPEKMPVFIGYDNTDMHYYGLPILEYPGLLKVCAHWGPEIQGPESRDSIGGPNTVTGVARFISNTFKGVAPKPSITEFCMYTVSPDDDPVIDRHPLHRNIIVASGFSGHGFKLSPVVGKLIVEMVTSQSPSHDLAPFSLARFQTPKSSL